jgi:hypothetical protein
MGLVRRWGVWVGLAVVVTALAIDILVRHDRIGVDFHTYLAAARVGLQDGWSHIYDQPAVALAQDRLVPGGRTQPFLSPPTVAWIVAPLSALPYPAAYAAWAVLTLAGFALALAWAGLSRGAGRWVAVAGALAPWWVLHAVNVGQVGPVVAAAIVVSWRLLRDRKDVAAGLVLALILLKPNVAMLVPFALIMAGRQRAFFAWLAGAAVVLVLAVLTLGAHGTSAYLGQLMGQLPNGADNLTIHGALGLTGVAATALRVAIVAAVLGAAYRFRSSSAGIFIPIAAVGSLLITPYLHASDLCILAAAAWIAWEELPSAAWRVPLAAAWVLASPFFYLSGLTPQLNRWPLLEIAFLGALAITAWRPLTGWADSSRRATA